MSLYTNKQEPKQSTQHKQTSNMTAVVEENRGYSYLKNQNPNDIFHIDNNENTQVKTQEDLVVHRKHYVNASSCHCHEILEKYVQRQIKME